MDDLTTNFSLIKLRYKATSLNKVKLHDIFGAVIKGKYLEVDQFHMNHILENELTINISKIDKRLVKVLRESLIYYMVVWPGWQLRDKYLNDDVLYKVWFEMYTNYLITKSNFVISSTLKYTKPDVEVADQSTQTNQEVVKKVAPYTLYIGGPPTVLNNIVFVEDNGDVLIKQHIGNMWKMLTPLQFHNWPHVSVEVKLPEFSFTRTVSHEYERFIALKGETMKFKENENVAKIKKLQPGVKVQPYSYDLFKSYIFQLNKTLQKIPCISHERLIELRFILSQFLVDVQEINDQKKNNILSKNNAHIMCTNTLVCFRIGNSTYLRNKKIVNNLKNPCTMRQPINFYEVINPQIDLALFNFDGVPDLSVKDSVVFKSLNELSLKCDSGETHDDLNSMRFLIDECCITYACTLCNERFEGARACDQMKNHFAVMHNFEQPVLCCKCGMQFEVIQLAGCRWKHTCQSKK